MLEFFRLRILIYITYVAIESPQDILFNFFTLEEERFDKESWEKNWEMRMRKLRKMVETPSVSP